MKPNSKKAVNTAIVFIVLGGSNAIADIYKWKDTAGTTHYSNGTQPTTEKFTKPNIQTEYTPATTQPRYYYQNNQNQYTPQRQIIVQENTDSDYQQCADVKRRAVIAERQHSPRANDLDEWLWKNCRSYASELRQIEQDMM